MDQDQTGETGSKQPNDPNNYVVKLILEGWGDWRRPPQTVHFSLGARSATVVRWVLGSSSVAAIAAKLLSG